MASLEIAFDSANPKGEFYAGEAISGTVIIKLTKPISLTTIELGLKGKGLFSWKAGKTRFVAREVYLNSQIVINVASGSVTVDVGTHSFPFSINLPSNLPQSYVDSVGFVRYKITTKIKSSANISFLKNSCDKKKPFTLLASLPLTPTLREPTRVDHSKKMPCLTSCFCWWHGDVIVTTTTDKGGYFPGETILFKADILNKSNKDLKDFTLEMKRKATYICRPSEKRLYTFRKSKRVSTELKLSHVIRAGESATLAESIVIPSEIPPTDLGGSHILNIDYYVQLSVACAPSEIPYKHKLLIGSGRPGMMAPTATVITQQPMA